MTEKSRLGVYCSWVVVDTFEAEAVSVLSQDTELAEDICFSAVVDICYWSSLDFDCRLELWH